MVVIIINIRYI